MAGGITPEATQRGAVAPVVAGFCDAVEEFGT